MNYHIIGGVPNTDKVWGIVINGQIAAWYHGPMSLMCAVATIEGFKSIPWVQEGWIQRSYEYIKTG